MTPFGVKIRDWRQRKDLTLHQQAEVLGVSSAYLSALENGTRGRPSVVLVDQICAWLGLIWDDAEELTGIGLIFDQDMSNIPEVEAGIRASKKGKLTYANYQESRLRHFHKTIDKYIAKGPHKP